LGRLGLILTCRGENDDRANVLLLIELSGAEIRESELKLEYWLLEKEMRADKSLWAGVLMVSQDQFDDYRESTIGAAFLTQTISLDESTTVKFEIWDTAGQERYKSLAPMYYRNANCAVVVYDITQAVNSSPVLWNYDSMMLTPESPI